jgi:hypothetical protein
MSVIWTIILVIIIAYSILGWALYFLQPTFIYHPVREVPYDPGDISLTFEKVSFKTADDVKLFGWYIPAENAKYTVLFCHGNGGNIAHRLDTINFLNELGLNCFIFDYRGYGKSRGKPTEQGTYFDAEAAYIWLTENKKIPPQQIIIFGRSLGGSIGAYLAGKVPCKGIVLESTFTSYVDMGRKFYPYMPVKLFASFSYRTIDYIKQINVPMLIIHSRNDELVPFEFGLRLYDAANEPKEFIEIDGSHNDGFLFSGELYKQAWQTWLKKLPQLTPETKNAVIRKIPG